MKFNGLNCVLGLLLCFLVGACNNEKKSDIRWLSNALDLSVYQLKHTAETIVDSLQLPRSTWTGYDVDFLQRQLEHEVLVDSLMPNPSDDKLNDLRLCSIYDWTSGFFPGSLWYAYELTGNDTIKNWAIKYTNILNPIRYYSGNHDIGFMMNCSYGNALRLSPNDTIKSVLVETADNLCSRYDSAIGCIRSWDFGVWNYPVIIDNMMNLDLLFNVYRMTNDKKYYDVAVSHANTTLKNHFRNDYTTYHVISYNNDGSVEMKGTFQGKNDESAWSRGQAWALYGYTMCYRETGMENFKKQAIAVADMIMARTKTDDYIPYWDFDAPTGCDTPRDASAAAITSSAMLELSYLVENGNKYFLYAENILKNLSSPEYLSIKGENSGFILKHSTGSLPHGSEIDTPINYADYYYLEAIKRYRDIVNKK